MLVSISNFMQVTIFTNIINQPMLVKFAGRTHIRKLYCKYNVIIYFLIKILIVVI